MDKETIAKMQETLAGMKTKAEGIKTDLGNMKAPDAQSTQGTILDILTKKILGDSGGVSSANTGIDTIIQDAKASAVAVQEAGAARIGLEAGEMAGDIKTAGEQTLTSAREAQRGFGTNTAALKAIQDNTTKQLNDLDKRKDQALLENNTALVDKISNLQLKAIEFQQQAEQQTFSNILGLGQFAQSMQQEQRLQAKTNRSSAEIIGSVDKGLYSVIKNDDGSVSIEQILDPQFAGEEPTTKIIGTPDQGLYTVTIDAAGNTSITPLLESQKDVSGKDRLAMANSFAAGFEDKLGGWGVPANDKEGNPTVPGKKEGDKISDKELRNYLVSKYGIQLTEAAAIVDALE